MSIVVLLIVVFAVVALLGLLAMSLSGRVHRGAAPVAAAPRSRDEALQPRSHAEAARSEGRS
jgi:hypothetical protein